MKREEGGRKGFVCPEANAFATKRSEFCFAVPFLVSPVGVELYSLDQLEPRRLVAGAKHQGLLFTYFVREQ